MKKQIIKTATTFIAVILLAALFLPILCSDIQAKTKTTKYSFSPSNVTTFSLSDGRLRVELSDSTFQKNGKETVTKTLNKKVAPDCKWVISSFDRLNADTSTSITTYEGIKAVIQDERNYYMSSGTSYNLGLTTIVLRKGKVVKVNYLSMT